MQPFRTIEHEVDFCVVGGGMAGLCAAISAARHGARTVLMHDRPVLGGNASSECRVHVQGADRHGHIANMRETGILEELRLDNVRRNPNRVYSIWDTVLYEKARFQPNLTLLLNCSCCGGEMDGDTLVSIDGWQLTTQTRHTVRAKFFADCSGDGVLAPITGAAVRIGREGRDEYGESIAPEQADARTMGMTCYFQTRLYDTPQPFEPPRWANRYDTCDEIPYGEKGHRCPSFIQGYWWVELGGEDNGIHDTERLRDELLAIAYGLWDHIKNRCPQRAEAANWAIDWVQFLPAKRESRRYIGDHVLCQGDIASGGRFDDLVAYGGWSMDDHHFKGFRARAIGAPATIFHPAPSPYGIPYRSLYSRNVANLMFAGRVASCTHAAMSSTRLQGTGCVMGQAVGTAAAIAVREGIAPRGVGAHIRELQQTLMADDCYLPGLRLEMSELTRAAKLTATQGDPDPVRDGVSRPVGDDIHAWVGRPGDCLEYRFAAPAQLTEIALTLDGGFDQNITLSYQRPPQPYLGRVPDAMPRAFAIEALVDGDWRTVAEFDDNHQRHVVVRAGVNAAGARLRLLKTWGAPQTRVYGFHLK